MKGYQWADKPYQEVGSLGDVDRTKTPAKRLMHGARPEGGSYCIRGRKSYQLTEDPTRVECKDCRKLMGLEAKR